MCCLLDADQRIGCVAVPWLYVDESLLPGKWLSFNLVNSWRLFQVCFAEVWKQAGRSCDVGSGQLWSQECAAVTDDREEVGRRKKREVKLLL